MGYSSHYPTIDATSVLLGELQALVASDADHGLHQVQPRHRLRHRVLHLRQAQHTRIRLQRHAQAGWRHGGRAGQM